MSTSGMGVVVWERMNDGGRWQAYDPHISDYIEGCGHSIVNLGRVDVSFAATAIDIKAKLQLDTGSSFGPVRPVRRKIYPADGPAGKGIVWQWAGDRAGEWHRYDYEVAGILEMASSQGLLVVDLSQQPCALPYIIDLKSMVQMRVETGFTRRIQRLTSQWVYMKAAPLSSSRSSIPSSVPNGQSFVPPFSVSVSVPVPAHPYFPVTPSNGFLNGTSAPPHGLTTFTGMPYPGLIIPGTAHATNGSLSVVPSTSQHNFQPVMPASFNFGSANAKAPGVSVSNISAAPAKIGARTKTNHGSSKKSKTTERQASSTVMNDDYLDNPEVILKSYFDRVGQPAQDEDCAICCELLTDPSGYDSTSSDPYVVQLNKCKHCFHHSCVFAMYKSGTKDGSLQCPTCKAIYGVKCGNCPKGIMEHCVVSGHLPGYENCRIIRIMYMISGGIQGPEHPNPGKKYSARGFPRYGFLPDNAEGQKVLRLLIKAWKRRLTFTIGTSVTTGETDTVVWNEIHHKTEVSNQSGHGYPDANYLENVTAELAVHGITDDDQS